MASLRFAWSMFNERTSQKMCKKDNLDLFCTDFDLGYGAHGLTSKKNHPNQNPIDLYVAYSC